MKRPIDSVLIETGKTIEVAGWLSPSGDLYQCDYWEHDKTADLLCAQLEPYHTCISSSSDRLVELGWFRIKTEGYIYQFGPPTDAQFTVLHLLALTAKGTEYKKNMSRLVKRAINGSISNCTERFNSLPSQGDQENLPIRRYIYR